MILSQTWCALNLKCLLCSTCVWVCVCVHLCGCKTEGWSCVNTAVLATEAGEFANLYSYLIWNVSFSAGCRESSKYESQMNKQMTCLGADVLAGFISFVSNPTDNESRVCFATHAWLIMVCARVCTRACVWCWQPNQWHIFLWDLFSSLELTAIEKEFCFVKT